MPPARHRLCLPACFLALCVTCPITSPAFGEPATAQPAADDAPQPVPLHRTDEPPPPAAQPQQGDPSDEPNEQEIREQMLELERQLKEAREKLQQRAQEQRQQAEQAGHERLEQAVLPDMPTREQCEAYIADLREAATGKRSFSSNDPIVDKLRAVPVEHYDLLMTEMANRTPLRYFANYAMRDIDPELLRDRFVTTLADKPRNIGVIVMNGWCEDVRPVILRQVQAADASISPAWFQAAVEIADPQLYPKLHELTTTSRYAVQFVNMLRALPDYDLDHTIEVCWRRAADGKLPVSTSSFAALAAESGNVEALGTLIAQLRMSTNYLAGSTTYNIRRINVLRFIDFRGSNTEIQAWFDANKDKLVFDHFRGRYIIPDAF